eukprot:3214208-Lingulodinium_polyedra.AAC.1
MQDNQTPYVSRLNLISPPKLFIAIVRNKFDPAPLTNFRWPESKSRAWACATIFTGMGLVA